MAIEYSGWIEVPRLQGNQGGTARIPFTFQAENILSFTERQERLRELYNSWLKMLADSDQKREGAYGEPIVHRFTSVNDLGFGPVEGEPHFGK